jgi:hypothetical protein
MDWKQFAKAHKRASALSCCPVTLSLPSARKTTTHPCSPLSLCMRVRCAAVFWLRAISKLRAANEKSDIQHDAAVILFYVMRIRRRNEHNGHVRMALVCRSKGLCVCVFFPQKMRPIFLS